VHPYDYLDHDDQRQVVFEIYQCEDGDLGYASFPCEAEVKAASERIRLALALPLDVEIANGFF
jgi:hypothetical protein